MTSLDLSKVNFTNLADVVEPGVTIFNPEGSNVSTLGGADLLIGTSTLIDDFGFGVLVEVVAQNASQSEAVDLSSQATLYADGIHNLGSIMTNQGQDIVTGTATAKITAIAQTVSEAIAIANFLDTSVIAETFASIDIKAIANGIKNSGKISTGEGSDTINGDIQASVVAVATATVDATAIVDAIAQAPLSEGLTAFAGAIAQSLAKATVTATGINNIRGQIATNEGADTISANATSESATFAEASAFAFAAATPENQALALTVVEAIAQTQDKAIAIDNRKGYISLGLGDDIIEATAAASDQAIAINSNYGYINLGLGEDIIYATATADERAVAITNVSGFINLNRGKAIIDATATADERAVAINNTDGEITVGLGKDTIEANAIADEIAIAIYNTDGSTNLYLEDDIIEATATADKFAIAINNPDGYISLGIEKDIIEATATADKFAIAINNTDAKIDTGDGADIINAQATGAKSYGIYGGDILTGDGADKVKASSFGGGVKIEMGGGDDWLEGFGNAEVDGGEGVDTLSLNSHSILDFLFNDNNISFGANSDVSFHLDGTTLYAKGFEQFNFAGGVAYTYDQLELASDVSFNLDGITL